MIYDRTSPKWGERDPFQMAELHGLQIGVVLTTYESWDDPPSMVSKVFKIRTENSNDIPTHILADVYGKCMVYKYAMDGSYRHHLGLRKCSNFWGVATDVDILIFCLMGLRLVPFRNQFERIAPSLDY